MAILGITCNNPCNIRFTRSNHWKGQIGNLNGFVRFSSVDYGVRAVLSLLRVYFLHYNLNTVRKIISRYAPSFENKTEYYIEFVVRECNSYGYNITADSVLNLDFYDYKGICPLYSIVRAMCLIETGFVLLPSQFARCLKLIHV